MFALLALAATLHLAAADAEKSFTVAPRTVIVVTLPVDFYTRKPGSHWEYVPYYQGPRDVRVLSHRFVRRGKGGKRREVWRFRATRRGRSGIELVYFPSKHWRRRFAVAWSATIRVR